ncbi:hypothetical protein [Paenibacillus sp. NAIST15-1]|uniref:hypothetical protein n=1 Tax=Paenibacillus sp. NAIST15-1 TaxID=1605994 RepID=UPI000868E1D3|nr:hypothetical protein [Paenibacillus sp. NAIST15-1]GAV11499.1 TonB-dependent receptor [Paenibacillus sp. NAIST15-1]
MGEISEYYIDKLIFNEPRRCKPQKVVWTTSDGVVHEPRDMSNRHLMNVLHVCERREGYKGVRFLNNAPTYRTIVLELINRGVLSNNYFDLTIENRLKIRLD